MKIFGLYDPSEVKVEDPGLKDYINLKATYVPHSAGRFNKPFGKTEVSIVERLINRLQVTGHDGKKHKLKTIIQRQARRVASFLRGEGRYKPFIGSW